MANAQATYRDQQGRELTLKFHIDLKTQTIQELLIQGELTTQMELELNEFKTIVLGQTMSEIYSLKRESLQAEKLLDNGQLAIASLPLWLTHIAMDEYLGLSSTLNEQVDVLCLCYGVTKRDLKKELLKRAEYDLPQLIAETYATSACGSCRNIIKKTFEDLRVENGLIKGLAHSQTRIDKEGHWVKIKNFYPAELIIYLDDLKKEWMKREEIENLFDIQIENIEGPHLWLSVKSLLGQSEERDKHEKILIALSDYYKSVSGILLFLHLAL
jgi:bacterioferritin-associated ferredoxin